MSPITNVAVMGAGAVGSYFGAMLARAGHPVMLIGRPAHVQAIAQDGLRVETTQFTEYVRMQTSSDPSAVHGADLILFCVKSTDTEQVAAEIASHLIPTATVLSLQNGVDNAERIARHLPNRVIPAVVYVATAVTTPGCVKHFGRGDLVIGEMKGMARHRNSYAESLQQIARLFEGAAVPVRVSENVAGELWAKLVVNCAYNAISALGQASYARLASQGPIREVIREVVLEVIAVATACGVELSPGETLRATEKIAVSMAGQLSSTAQDVARRKRTEIDYLNGFVVRKGREFNIPTPVNHTLHALVKLMEAGYLTK